MNEIVRQVQELVEIYRRQAVEISELRAAKHDLEQTLRDTEETLQETAKQLDQAHASLGFWQKQMQEVQKIPLLQSELNKAKYDREEMYKEMNREKHARRELEVFLENLKAAFEQRRGAFVNDLKNNRDNLQALADDAENWTLPLDPEARKEQPPDETPQPSLVGAD